MMYPEEQEIHSCYEEQILDLKQQVNYIFSYIIVLELHVSIYF